MSLQMENFHSFLWLSTILLYVCVYHIFFIHSFVDEYLGCFHVLLIFLVFLNFFFTIFNINIISCHIKVTSDLQICWEYSFSSLLLLLSAITTTLLLTFTCLQPSHISLTLDAIHYKMNHYFM